ncbi:hypothetical protein KSP35_22115 [Aquihabitans sp. G128]|uniref:hypothetical protein n=1 Tax=Aquihabitans sp. G128 TaxID=2849779 RepID=UPI001C22FEEC|nr:hypothetical protein [Aquihabitans sp. G128]QXC60975.1 hypothetical protein KSP35_22115 [Aquihabitans sp. G128]
MTRTWTERAFVLLTAGTFAIDPVGRSRVHARLASVASIVSLLSVWQLVQTLSTPVALALAPFALWGMALGLLGIVDPDLGYPNWVPAHRRRRR